MPEALSLTAEYDEGRRSYALEWVGKNLTHKGLPVRPGATGIQGLFVMRVYTLPDRQARLGAQPVN